MGKLLRPHPELADALASTLDPATRRSMRSVSFREARAAWERNGADASPSGATQRDPSTVLPSCSVVQVEYAGSRIPAVIPSGTPFTAKAQPTCRFRTVYDVTIVPLAIASARFMPRVDVLPIPGMPDRSACAIVIAIETTDPAIGLHAAATGPVRLFIDADPATRAALHDALLARTLYTCVQADREWFELDALPFAPEGDAANEALLPAPNDKPSTGDQEADARQGLRLLTEYFAFSEKFDFLDIDLEVALACCPGGIRKLALHVMLPALPNAASLHALAPSMLRLGCTPVVSLFDCAAEPSAAAVDAPAGLPIGLPDGDLAGDGAAGLPA